MLTELPRHLERQVEVWGEVLPYQPIDLEEMAFQMVMELRAYKRQQYRDMRLFDPAAYRAFVDKQQRKRESRPGYVPRGKVTQRHVREMAEMHRLGVPVKLIAKTFSVTARTVMARLKEARGLTLRRGEKVRPAKGAAHARSKATPELVAKVMAMDGSFRSIGRALGVSHTLVSLIKAGKAWSQTGGQ